MPPIRLFAISLLLWALPCGQAPCAERVPEIAPTEKGITATGANGGESNPFGVPVIIVETPDQAQKSQEAEAKSDRTQADNLQAQIRAAKATEQQNIPAWVSVFLNSLGTLLIVITLVETRRAIGIAAAANKISASSLSAQLAAQRPYVILSNGRPNIVGNDGRVIDITLEADFLNIGGSPAFITGVEHGHHIGQSLPTGDIKNFTMKGPDILPGWHFIRPDSSRHFGAPIDYAIMNPNQFESIIGGDESVWFFGFVTYKDGGGTAYRTGFGFVFIPDKENPREVGTLAIAGDPRFFCDTQMGSK